MPIKYIDECCNCATPSYPCNGRHKKIRVPYCDDCGEDEETIYKYNGEDLCLRCIVQRLERVE